MATYELKEEKKLVRKIHEVVILRGDPIEKIIDTLNYVPKKLIVASINELDLRHTKIIFIEENIIE